MGNSFQQVKAIFFSRNQNELESAMWGGALRGQDARRIMRDKAQAQIERAELEFQNPIPYRAMTQIQLGILQMGLGEDYSESGNSILKGIAESWHGDEYDIVTISTLGFSTLAHWTDRADIDSRFRCNLLVNWLVEKELFPQHERSSSSKQDVLTLAFSCLTVLSFVWRFGLDMNPNGVSTISETYLSASNRAKSLDNFFEYQLPVSKWMNQRVKRR
jgi:hypothetical protein